MKIISERAEASADEIRKVFQFLENYRKDARESEIVADLTFGNPQEMPLPGLVNALKHRVEPQKVDWFAYKTSEEEPRAVVAEALRSEMGLDFHPDDIALTQGAFGAIALAFAMLLDPGDECIIPHPGWFAYGTMLRSMNAVPVKVALANETFDLDIDAIEKAITPRTRIVVVNTPHNPTGIVYGRDTLVALAEMLLRKSKESDRPIFVLSDEPYRRIRFDGISFTSPAAVYPFTLVDYSYGKVLLSPGLRIGYLAIGPGNPDPVRNALREMASPTQISLGWAFPDAPLQYAMADLEALSIDVAALQAKRDRLHGALEQWGYRMTRPSGTFYLWGRAPGGDSLAFTDKLARKGVFVMPGTLFDRPADFRICLTGTAQMIEASLPVFQKYAEQ